MERPPAMLNSSRAVASPPSVISCMALVPAVAAAILASVIMLMLSKNWQQRSISPAAMPNFLRRTPNSLAIMAVPSTASPLVNSTRSPFSIRRLSIRSRRATVPAIIPATMGRATASVISVCPPHNVMPHCRQKLLSSSNTY